MKLIRELLETESTPLVFVADDSSTGDEAAFLDFCKQYQGKLCKFYPDSYFCVLHLNTSELDRGNWTANLNQGETDDELLGIILDTEEDDMSNAGDPGPTVAVKFEPRASVEVDFFHEDSFDHNTKDRLISEGSLHYSQISKIEVFGTARDYHMKFFNSLKQ